MTYKIESDDDGCTYVTRDGDPVSAGDVLRSLVAHDALVAALDGLRNSVAGCWGLDEAELRRILSNTNYAVVMRWIDEADSALALAKENER